MSDRTVRLVRTTLGVILAIGLAYVTVRLIPPYFENSRFQSYLDDAVSRPVPPDMLKVDIVNQAVQMGLPLHESDVHMAPTSGNGLKVDIVYVNRVDLKLYTVDLHFHPSARR